jgi:copper chaperone CopZ
MKKTFFLALLWAIVSPASAQFKKAQIQASGLTCSLCSNAINKALKTLPFVAEVKSNIQASAFDVSFKPGANVDFDAIEQKVSGAGFSVAQLKVLTQFPATTIQPTAEVSVAGTALYFLQVSPQTIQGDKEIIVLGKKFLLPKEYAKYSAALKAVPTANKKIYFVTL